MALAVVEAVGAAQADRWLASPAAFWSAWAATVGIYASAGWAAFGVIGFVVGTVAGCFRRAWANRFAAVYYALGAMALVAVLSLGRADLDLPPEALRLVLLRVGGKCVAVGAVVWAAARWVGPRLHIGPAGKVGLAIGYLVGGGAWARWGADGLSRGEKICAWAAGAGALAAAYLVLTLCSRTRTAAQGRGVAAVFDLLLPVALLGAVAAAGWRIAFPSPRRGAPDVLLVTVDALRADRLGCYGSSKGLTPNLDHLAREAVVFENAFTSAPWTGASVGAMLVSRYPSELGLVPLERTEYRVRFQGGLLTPQATLAEVLRQAGYGTAAELVNPQIRRDRGYARGFVRFRNPDDFAGERALALPRLGRYGDWFLAASLGRYVAAAAYRAPRYYRAPGVARDDAERLVRDAQAWLRSQGPRPFFLWLHLMDTHVPYDPPQLSAQTRAAFPRPPLEPTAQLFKDLVCRRVEISEPGKRYLKALYDDELRYADLWLGRLLDDLRQRGRYENTLIIVSADHGEEFWDHGRYEHGHSMYDEVLRVPLLVKFPGGRHAGRRVSGQARLIDLLPTVLDIVGAPIPRGVRGQPLTDLVRARHASARELYAESTLYGEELKALRTPEYKLIFHTESRRIEVYDLRRDPREQRDLGADRGVAAELRARLLRLARESEQRSAWWARFGEKLPALDPRSLERLRSIGYMAE